MAESDGEIDGVWPIEDLTPDAVTALAMRIQGSWTSEQLVYREAELDDLWRQAETARGESRRRDDSAADTLARVSRGPPPSWPPCSTRPDSSGSDRRATLSTATHPADRPGRRGRHGPGRHRYG
jgi:hypothetical protein